MYVEALAPGIDASTLEISVVRGHAANRGRETAHFGGHQAGSVSSAMNAAPANSSGSVTLPVEVNGDKVTAEYKNGLLLITLPKPKPPNPSRSP